MVTGICTAASLPRSTPWSLWPHKARHREISHQKEDERINQNTRWADGTLALPPGPEHQGHGGAISGNERGGTHPDDVLRQSHAGYAQDFPVKRWDGLIEEARISTMRVVFSSSTERIVMTP